MEILLELVHILKYTSVMGKYLVEHMDLWTDS